MFLWEDIMDLTTDFQELVSQNLDYEFLRNKTLLITGATGMLGRYLTEYFIYLNAEKNLNLMSVHPVLQKPGLIDYP